MKKIKKEIIQKKNEYERNNIQNEKELVLFTIQNFLKEEECEYLSTIIQKNNQRSMVASNEKGISKYDEGRTSSTATLSPTDPIVSIVEKRICDELEVKPEYGESFQGQLYEVGQEFRHHTDYFTADSYSNHCLHSGQRTWTCMIYLNDVEEGGFTDFPHIGYTIKPKKGMAVVWKNSDGTGKEYPASQHAGLPVLNGKKIIITKWFREKPWDMAKDISLATEYWKKKESESIVETELENSKISTVKNEKNISKSIKTVNKLPKLTPLGFKVTKVPPKTWKLIQEVYFLLKENKIVRKENWDGITNFIHNKDGNESHIDFFDMDVVPRMKEIIQEELKCVHDAFIDYKEELDPVWIYGLRSYTDGAVLKTHYDRPNTHHISSIVIVDKDVVEDWPLQIQDHDGNWHEIFTEPGDMILYESAICAHGRTKPLNGKYYRNFFVHYKLKNYNLI